MSHSIGNVARLYLPLLAHAQADVRRQASAILLATHGALALTALHALLDDADPAVRAQARQGLAAIASSGEGAIAQQPSRGMYVECLGHLRVWVGSRQIAPRDWMQPEGGRAGWRKVQGAFAYLVHRGRSGSRRKELSQAIWGGAASAASLARTLTALRQTLAGADDAALIERALTTDGEQLSLAADAYTSDAQFFEQTFEIACRTEEEGGLAQAAPLYAQALRLYSGPYMLDVAGSDEWGQRRRDHLSGSAVIAAERLAEHAYAEQRYRECVAICGQGLEIDEAAEELSSWLLRAYDRLNLRHEIGRAYRSYLHAATLSPDEAEGHANPVVRTYRELTGARDGG